MTKELVERMANVYVGPPCEWTKEKFPTTLMFWMDFVALGEPGCTYYKVVKNRFTGNVGMMTLKEINTIFEKNT